MERTLGHTSGGRRADVGAGVWLRGLANEVRQAMLGVEIADLERRRELDVLSGLATWRRHGVEVSGATVEKELGRRGSTKSVMRSQPDVVVERDGQPALEVGPQELRSSARVCDRLQGPEEPLDESDGSGLSERAVAVPDAAASERLPERLRRELRSLVGDGVSWRSEAAGGGGEEPGDVAVNEHSELTP